MNLESISSKSLCKELAYLLGVYLTDGSISSSVDKWGRWYNFSLKAIDKDFVELTLKCIKKIKPDCRANIYEQKPRTRYWSDGRISKCQKQYCLNVGFTGYKDFFINQTGRKHHIPYIIWNATLPIKKWFIAGVMDGDGYIAYHTRPNKKIQWTTGIGGIKEGWIYEFKQLLNQMNIGTNKEEMLVPDGKIRKTPFVRFNIKIVDFVGNGLFFMIKRKQDRIKLYTKMFRD